MATEATKIGVLVCRCGDEIAGALDVDRIVQEVARLPGVALAQTVPYGCGPEGEERLQEIIRGGRINRLVLAGCSPRLMEKRFHHVCGESGLNPSCTEMVNLREHCARVRPRDGSPAERKALALVRMGLERVRARQPASRLRAELVAAAAVVGGGIAGMTAAVSLAEQGIPVKLIEREASLGGLAVRLGTGGTPGTSTSDPCIRIAERVRRCPNIEVITQAEVRSVTGSYGNYTIELAVDGGRRSIQVGAAILAAGSQVLRPEGLYGYGRNPRVITQLDLEERLTRPGVLEGVSRIVMIQCAGSRIPERPACGRICCAWSVHNAIRIRRASPGAAVTIVHGDLVQEAGLDARVLEEARRLGVQFVKWAGNGRPEVTESAVIAVTEADGRVELAYDWVVLSTPRVPWESTRGLARAFRVPVDNLGFLPDSLPRLKPDQYAEPCVRVAGNAHGPCSAAEAMEQAYGRAAQIASLLRRREVLACPRPARVELEACRGCATCRDVCPFDVPVLSTGNGSIAHSSIDPFLCKGCGGCAVHCPTGAITMEGSPDVLFYREIEAALAGRDGGPAPAIAFVCEWSGYALWDLAGTRGVPLPAEIIPVRIPCAARVSPGFILSAFGHGASGVLVCACQRNDCHYLSGNLLAEQVFQDTARLLRLLGIEGERLRMEWLSPMDLEGFQDRLEEFASRLKACQGSVQDS
ncbi:MAG: hydrogenase iron-sulfur subunit [Planctomycetes bacterium]|nr:hydrogenase iron-sulfur subunit [Planctomycetota bacterium]